MSTKVTIRRRERSKSHPGFHIYDDVLDAFGEHDDERQTLIYLRIEGVGLVVETLTDGGAVVTIALPREVARDLGLLSTVDCSRVCGQA